MTVQNPIGARELARRGVRLDRQALLEGIPHKRTPVARGIGRHACDRQPIGNPQFDGERLVDDRDAAVVRNPELPLHERRHDQPQSDQNNDGRESHPNPQT